MVLGSTHSFSTVARSALVKMRMLEMVILNTDGKKRLKDVVDYIIHLIYFKYRCWYNAVLCILY